MQSSDVSRHLIFGRGGQTTIAGLLIYFGSMALWAYAWAAFTATAIYFIRSGFDIVSTVTEMLYLIAYPIIAVPMYTYVLLYRHVYCPIMSWFIRHNPLGAVEHEIQTGQIGKSGVKTEFDIFKWIFEKGTGVHPGAVDQAVQGVADTAELKRYPEFCPLPGTEKSRGCAHPDRNASIFSRAYWFCGHDKKDVGSVCTTNCNK